MWLYFDASLLVVRITCTVRPSASCTVNILVVQLNVRSLLVAVIGCPAIRPLVESVEYILFAYSPLRYLLEEQIHQIIFPSFIRSTYRL